METDMRSMDNPTGMKVTASQKLFNITIVLKEVKEIVI